MTLKKLGNSLDRQFVTDYNNNADETESRLAALESQPVININGYQYMNVNERLAVMERIFQDVLRIRLDGFDGKDGVNATNG